MKKILLTLLLTLYTFGAAVQAEPTNGVFSWFGSNKNTSKPTAPPVVESKSFTDRMSGVVDEAFGLIGIRYRYGGSSPDTGLDCSGFVSYVFKQSLDIALPHNALAMSKLGDNIARQDLQPGDLVFFNTMRRSFSHVGIYIGDNKFIHSPRTGKSVEITSMNNSYFSARFEGARRVATNGQTVTIEPRILEAAQIGDNP
jgi:cell wall-associated NlpC family hydrolase